jgi:hypothetical protein
MLLTLSVYALMDGILTGMYCGITEELPNDDALRRRNM